MLHDTEGLLLTLYTCENVRKLNIFGGIVKCVEWNNMRFGVSFTVLQGKAKARRENVANLDNAGLGVMGHEGL